MVLQKKPHSSIVTLWTTSTWGLPLDERHWSTRNSLQASLLPGSGVTGFVVVLVVGGLVVDFVVGLVVDVVGLVVGLVVFVVVPVGIGVVGLVVFVVVPVGIGVVVEAVVFTVDVLLFAPT